MMDDKLKWVLAGVGALMLYTLYQSYQVPPENGGNGDDGTQPATTYTYTVTCEGPGYVVPNIGGEEKPLLSRETVTFSDIEYGTFIGLNIQPEEGAELMTASNTSFTISNNTSSTVKFTSTTGNGDYGDTGHPYGLTDEQWSVCTDGVKDLLENKNWTHWIWLPLPIPTANTPVRIGLNGWWNDMILEPVAGETASSYAQKIAAILKEGAPEVIHTVNFMGPWDPREWGSMQEIINRINSML